MLFTSIFIITEKNVNVAVPQLFFTEITTHNTYFSQVCSILEVKTQQILIGCTFHVARRFLSSFMTSVACIEVIGHQRTSRICSSQPFSFVQTPLSSDDDQRRLGKERPVERFTVFRRANHINTALHSNNAAEFSIYQSSNYPTLSLKAVSLRSSDRVWFPKFHYLTFSC